VDPLPFLEVGYWAGVHIASLAPEETLTKLAADPDEKKQSGTRPRMPGGGNTYAGGGANEQSLRGGMDSDMYGQMMGQMMGGRGLMGMGEESSRGGGGMMGRGGSGLLLGGGGGGGNTTEVPAELHTDAETVMVRVVDYTVEPDSIYRYRLRIVVNNPNYRRDNVTPGTDKTSKELSGPWSDLTSEISVPSDVATYALRKTPSDANRDGDQMQFQVVRFDPNKGLTIVKTFDHAPGQIIGGATSAAVPKDDYKGQTMTQVDFLSRQILVDTAGGQRALTILGHAGKKLEAPASALVVRGDGLLVLRDQVQDMASGEMKEMDEIYKRTLEDSKPEEKKSSTLYGGMEGMMGGRGGMNSF
jgi:hypothetical protein